MICDHNISGYIIFASENHPRIVDVASEITPGHPRMSENDPSPKMVPHSDKTAPIFGQNGPIGKNRLSKWPKQKIQCNITYLNCQSFLMVNYNLTKIHNIHTCRKQQALPFILYLIHFCIKILDQFCCCFLFTYFFWRRGVLLVQNI